MATSLLTTYQITVLLISCLIGFVSSSSASELLSPSTATNNYIGSDSCKNCHQAEHQLWQQSDHHKAMQAPDIESVLGDFNNVEVEFHGIKTRFFKDKKAYFVETTNKQGERETFDVKYTFGFAPLQQYILDTGKGHMQAFNIVWDTRPVNQGGQRWYHLQPNESITPDHPFFWQRHFQNWNSRCAECHTTGYEKNYQLETNSFNTQFAEPTVGCESCHGPAKAHQEQAQQGKFSTNKGFIQALAKPPVWGVAVNDPIANLVGGGNTQYMQQCAACHSRRLPIDNNTSLNQQDYHNQFSLGLISAGTYFDDGQINDEVFVIGSFLQSKMAQAGVTCSNCHNPHSGKLKLQGNQICTQCHSATTFDVPEHHHHKVESIGSQCVDCHMPNTTYMQVDPRRDHSFVIPNSQVSAAVGSPNACLDCHAEQGLPWANQQLKTLFKQTNSNNIQAAHWSQIHLVNGDKQVEFAQQKMPTLPAIVSAKLLTIINQQPSQASVSLALQQLSSNEPMIRRAAIAVLRQLPPDQAFQYLSPLLKDPVKTVRFEAAAVLASWLAQMPKDLLSDLSFAVDEYRTALMVTADFPTSQLNLAQLALALGDNKLAQKHFEQALTIAPNLPIAMLAFADFYRQTNNQDKELALLEKAVQIHVDFADVLHQYGLFWVRKKEYAKASQWLVKATNLADSQPYYAYVAATALDTVSRTIHAVSLLLEANQRWPKQQNLLYSLALYADKTKNKEAMKIAMLDLPSLLPNNAQVKQWMEKFK